MKQPTIPFPLNIIKAKIKEDIKIQCFFGVKKIVSCPVCKIWTFFQFKKKFNHLIKYIVNFKSQSNSSSVKINPIYLNFWLTGHSKLHWHTDTMKQTHKKYYFDKKIAWIRSHHLHLQWKFKLLTGKFTKGNKAKHCWALSTNFSL